MALPGVSLALTLLCRLFRDRRVCVIAPLQPLDRMSVEEGPGGNHDEKGHCRACETEVHSKFDVLQEEPDDEGKELWQSKFAVSDEDMYDCGSCSHVLRRSSRVPLPEARPISVLRSPAHVSEIVENRTLMLSAYNLTLRNIP